MAENITLEIVTPEKIVINGEVKIVMAPGILGEFGVLSGHTPFLTSLTVGTVRFVGADDKEQIVFVSGGFAEAGPRKVTILAESAEKRQDIDTERAKAAMERARERIKAKSEEVDYIRARAALERSLHRLKIVER